MITRDEIKALLPLACAWAEEQETYVLENGVPLSEDLQIDAFLIGVKHLAKVRLLEVDTMPLPLHAGLKAGVEVVGLLTQDTIGVSFRYGIYVRRGNLQNRRLVVHELAHTMQYERMGGFHPFLECYIDECLDVGYPMGLLEQEARRIEKDICR